MLCWLHVMGTRPLMTGHPHLWLVSVVLDAGGVFCIWPTSPMVGSRPCGRAHFTSCACVDDLRVRTHGTKQEFLPDSATQFITNTTNDAYQKCETNRKQVTKAAKLNSQSIEMQVAKEDCTNPETTSTHVILSCMGKQMEDKTSKHAVTRSQWHDKDNYQVNASHWECVYIYISIS